MMIGWLIYRYEDVDKNKAYINFYIEEARALGIDIKLIFLHKLNFGVKDNALFLRYNGNVIERPDFAINRSIYPLLSKQLEDMGIKVFNNSKVADICNDKAKTYQYLSRLDIPIINTSFIKSENIVNVMDKIKEPRIIKGVSGHGGDQVFLYNPDHQDKSEVDIESKKNTLLANQEKTLVNQDKVFAKKKEILASLNNTDIVIQPVIGDKKQDLRVYVIGKTIIAAILRTAKDGFKSNYSLGGDVINYHLSDQETQLITKIINEFDFGLVGIDFLIEDDGSLLFNEIEDVVGSRMLYKCTDINIVNLYLKHILSIIS